MDKKQIFFVSTNAFITSVYSPIADLVSFGAAKSQGDCFRADFSSLTCIHRSVLLVYSLYVLRYELRSSALLYTRNIQEEYFQDTFQPGNPGIKKAARRQLLKI